MQEQIVEGYELSPQQKELWRAMRAGAGRGYGVCCEVRVEGVADAARLDRAVSEVLLRHEALRTSYERAGGLSYPLQVIGGAAAEGVGVRRAEAGGATRLVVEVGGLSGDRRSLRNLVGEIAAAYAAPEEPPASYLQYADASEIFNELVGSEETRDGREHWQRVSAEEAHEPELAFAKAAPAGSESAQVSFNLPAATQARLVEFCRERGVTVKAALLTAWAALLSRLGSQPHLRLYLISDGRRHEEIVSAVGLFARRLPLALKVEGSFTAALAAVSEQLELAEKWQEYYAAEREAPGGGYGFEFYERPAPVEAAGLRFVITRERVRQHRPRLSLGVGWGDDGARPELDYDAAAFSAEDAERVGEEYATLLGSALEESESPVAELEIVGPREREQLLAAVRGRVRPQSGEPVHEAFLRQARRRPEAIAVAGEEGQLSYAELERRANQLAWYLVKRGVGAEQVVGICLGREVGLVVGLLGILKAGGAYLPLDPTYPAARLRRMVADAGAALVLSESRYRGLMGEAVSGGTAAVVYLDEEREEIERVPVDGPGRRAGAENLAYVLYTSGSTGRPKGVMVEHGALSNHMEWIVEAAALGEHDTVLQKTGIGFDASVWEFWGALLAGGCLAVGGEGVMGGDEIVELVRRHRATVLQVVPTQLRLLVESGGLAECRSLRRVFSGGEALGGELVEKYYEQHSAPLTNLYGPTEATIDVTWKEVERGGRVTLGRAVDNTEVMALGGGQRLKATGEVGEIYVGGAGLARGYLGRAGLTAEKFVPDAVSGVPGKRLYRTGDLGRVVGGELEHVGRSDEQVKVRGYRIELGEIEAELNRQPEVKASAVVARDDEGGGRRLVAYVELREAVAAAELMKRLRERLPEWMVPAAYERVAKLPVSANGKVDRRQLREAASERLAAGGEYEQARSEVEEVLAGIWGEVLRVERVGVHDNFFELGGDSILSIKVIARANRAGLKLTPRQLFQNQTIAELASVATVGTAVKGQQGTVTGSVPLTAIQRRFFDENVTDPRHYNQSVLFETRTKLDERLLRRAVSALIAHHDALRLRFREDAGGWQQTNSALEQDCFTRIDLSAVAERDRASVLERAAAGLQTSLDLTDGPLTRAALFTLPAGTPDRFMIVIHHLATDGVSWRILLEDLQRVYEQLKDGEPVTPGFKTTSFQQWAGRMVEYAQSPEVMRELPFWLEMLGLAQDSLPADNPEGENDRASAQRFSLSLDREQTRALLQDAPRRYRTEINDLLMTALVEAFHRWAGLTSLSVSLEGHGREDIFEDLDLTRTVGWFTTIFPVRCVKVKGEGVLATLKRVKELLRSLPNKGIGYGLLKYLAEGDGGLKQLRESREPLVSLNYLGQLDQAVPPEGAFAAAQESMGPMQSERGRRPNLLDFSAGVLGGKFWIGCTYSANVYERETVETITKAFLDALKSLAAPRADSPARAYTPSDFPLARLDERSLGRLNAAYPNLEDVYPLSHMQQGMLFYNLYAPKSPTYFLQLGCTLKGGLDTEAFAKAWRGVISRHPILRTAFVWEGLEQPLQVVCADAEPLLEQADWRGLAPAQQEENFEALLKQDRLKGFDLSAAPLMRFSLIRTADDCYYFIWSRHHLLMDGWSLPLILKEVFALYGAHLKGAELEMEPARPFGDYIAWLNEQDMTAAEKFWREGLRGFQTPTLIGNGLARGTQAGAEESYGELRRQLSAEMTQALQSYARRQQLTLNTLLLGAWGVLLSRYSGADDVVFGTAVSGRPPTLPGVEAIVGVFINMLPLRVVLPVDVPLSEWLRQLQQRQSEMQQYEFTPLAHIQNWSDVPRGLPLFESILVFENYPMDEVLGSREGTLAISNLRSIDRNNNPLTWLIMPGPQLLLRLIYNHAQFEPAFIGKALEQFETVLGLLVKHSDLTLGEFLTLVADALRQHEVTLERMLEGVERAKLKNITRRAVAEVHADAD